jgi:hypothetical protein
MKKTSLALAFVMLTIFCFGQKKFEIKNGSKNYIASITVENCDETHCYGKGVIKLIDKKTNVIFQTLVSEDLYFFLDSTQKTTVNVIQLYNEQSPLIFNDFNFDGTEDIAIRNGNSSSYSGPSYDVYVYNSTRRKFVLSEELTNLVTDNLGMFETDSNKKRLTTYAKSGCCWHITTEYQVIPNKGLRKVYEFEEDATGGEFVIVTTRKLTRNKWISKSKKYKIADYYKN